MAPSTSLKSKTAENAARKHSRSRSINSPINDSLDNPIEIPSVRFLDLSTSTEKVEKQSTQENEKFLRPTVRVHAQLSKDFFNESMEDLSSSTRRNLSKSEPKVEQLDEVPAKFEILFGQEWMTAGTLKQMIVFMTGPVQSKYKATNPCKY